MGGYGRKRKYNNKYHKKCRPSQDGISGETLLSLPANAYGLILSHRYKKDNRENDSVICRRCRFMESSGSVHVNSLARIAVCAFLESDSKRIL
jgi:hypothetical protein